MWNRPDKRFSYSEPIACFLLVLIFSIVGNATLTAQTPEPLEEPTANDYDPSVVPLPSGPPRASRGAAIYRENCAPCHGQTGLSDGPVVANLPAPPPAFADASTIMQRSPAEYFHVTKYGRIDKLMPPWQNRLTDDEIWHVVAYVWYLHADKDEIDAAEQLLNASPDEGSDLLSQLNARYDDPATLFQTQEDLITELTTSASQLLEELSDSDLLGVADLVRAGTILPPWVSAYQPGTGRILGEVVLTAADGVTSTVAGVPVRLVGFLQFEDIVSQETETDSAGRYQFDQLSTDSDIFYVLEATYQDIAYESQVVALTAGDAQTASVDISVYNVTEDSQNLVLDRVNWVIDYAPGEVVVGQILHIGNRGNETVVGQSVNALNSSATVELSLPDSAHSLQFQNGTIGDRFLRDGNTVYDTAPIIPGAGSSQIMFSYRLPINGSSADVEQSFSYPIETINLLVADLPELEVNVQDLNFIGVENVQNISYRYWQGTDYPSRTFSVSLQGLLEAGEIDPRSAGTGASASLPPAAVATMPVMQPLVPILVGSAIFFLLIGLSFWPFTRVLQSEQERPLSEHKQRLISYIANLDDRHAAGELSESEWKQQRAAAKHELMTIARESK